MKTSNMDYKKKYKEALEKIRSLHRDYNQISTLIDVKEELENIFPELAESEDERIRKELLAWLKSRDGQILPIDRYNAAIAWLEEQGEHANFRNKIQIGDKVTRNEDGVLVNLSQLNRVAKKDEKQGEQKETLCDKCKKEQPSHSCQDITALGRCALEKQGEPVDIPADAVLDSNKDGLIADTIRYKREKQGEQKPAEWSEEDERIKNNLLSELTNLSVRKLIKKETEKKYASWLKILKDRYTWKPSNEQMEALKEIFARAGAFDDVLLSLINDLKKLKD